MKTPQRTQNDFAVWHTSGGIVMASPMSDAAKKWVADNGLSGTLFDGSIIVGWRTVGGLIDRIVTAGLTTNVVTGSEVSR